MISRQTSDVLPDDDHTVARAVPSTANVNKFGRLESKSANARLVVHSDCMSIPRDVRPLPLVVAEDLRKRILDGEWAPGEQLPSEATLAESARVSRPTIRSAIKSLVSMGLVRVRHGSGTFVTARPTHIVSGLQELRSTSEMIATSRGALEVRYRLRERRPATEEEAALFESTPPFDIIALERCFVAENEPVAFEWAMLNSALLPSDLDPEQIPRSVFSILEPLDLLPVQAVASVHASAEVVDWPELAKPDALYLCLTQQSFLADGRVITWSKTLFADKDFEFTIVRSRSPY